MLNKLFSNFIYGSSQFWRISWVLPLCQYAKLTLAWETFAGKEIRQRLRQNRAAHYSRDITLKLLTVDCRQWRESWEFIWKCSCNTHNQPLQQIVIVETYYQGLAIQIIGTATRYRIFSFILSSKQLLGIIRYLD